MKITPREKRRHAVGGEKNEEREIMIISSVDSG